MSNRPVSSGKVVSPSAGRYESLEYSHAPTSRASAAKAKLSHEQIASKAYSIWQSQGCPPGQDERNWFEAEAQLKTELGLA
jgi:hypothetical protein